MRSTLARGNIGLASDIICCPGGDFCSLANAKSIPLSAAIADDAGAIEDDLGPIAIKVSGCINACGHHHVGHIGVLGVEKAGEDWYQVLLGGRADGEGRLGVLIGKSVRRDACRPSSIALARHYLDVRGTPTRTSLTPSSASAPTRSRPRSKPRRRVAA